MKKYIIISTFLSFFAMSGCKSTQNKFMPTYNNGGYKIKILKKNNDPNSEETKVIVTVYDKETGEKLEQAKVKRGILPSKYRLPLNSPEDTGKKKYFFEAIFIGYKTVLTDFLDLSNAAEIQLDFYLVQDYRPMR